MSAEQRETAANSRNASIGPDATRVELNVNGRNVAVVLDPATTLVEVLRDTLGLTGTKIGCDRGACSACTVWVDGEVVSSCMTFALDVRGKQVVTIEGLAPDRSPSGASAGAQERLPADQLHPVQQAFIEYDALQCGFCTPGMVMSCARLVDRNPSCTLEDVQRAVSGHLCRCGTYPNIFKATLVAAERVRQSRKDTR